MASAVEGCREHPRQGKRADWPDGANGSAGDKRAFARGHGVVQSSGRAPVIRDRVGRDKRNRFSTYQVLCSSTRAYAGVRVGVFARRRRGGERAVDTVEVRGEGPGSRVNSSHGLLPFAAPIAQSCHQGLGAGWQASPLHFFFKAAAAPHGGVAAGWWRRGLRQGRRWAPCRCAGVSAGLRRSAGRPKAASDRGASGGRGQPRDGQLTARRDEGISRGARGFARRRSRGTLPPSAV